MHSDASVQGKTSCEVCGKSDERCFAVHLGGKRHVFDSFECAMRGLLPTCPLCGNPLLGPGVEVEDQLYCSQSCASLSDSVEM
jgi:hypothetical protein